MRKPLDGSKYSSWQVLEAANAYYALSNVFTDALPETMDGVDRAMVNMDAGVASATNRILALELYLKAILIGANLSMPLVHDLRILFGALPSVYRNKFLKSFDDRCGLDNGLGVAWQLTFSFQLVNDFENAKLGKRGKAQDFDQTLSGLLYRNWEGFVVSRYLFSDATLSQVSRYDYEYRRLAIICGILCETLEKELPNGSPTYKRTFAF